MTRLSPPNCRILVVDDDQIDAFIHQEVIRMVLPHARVEVQSDPRKAIEAALCTTPPDLILLDINMPVLSGWDVIDVLREAQCRIPVLMISSSDHPRDLEHASRSRVRALIAKPLTVEKLQAFLETINLGHLELDSSKPAIA